MRPDTQRGLGNAIALLLGSPEFDRIRLFLIADGSASDPEASEIIKYVGDEIRAHLVAHHKSVLAAKAGR